MPTKRTWILVADAARARTYSTIRGSKNFGEVQGGSFDNTALHSHARDTGADRPGRTVDSSGSARHAEEPRSDPHRKEKISFVRLIAKQLEHRHQEFDCLVFVAPPQILGEMRKAIGAQTVKRLVKEVDKDFTKIPLAELPARLAAILPRG